MPFVLPTHLVVVLTRVKSRIDGHEERYREAELG
jgi:hypothetical protein